MIDVKILTIFPRIFDSFLAYGNPARAIEAGLMRVEAVDLRDFTDDRHRTTDDYPYGGGTGMVMKPEPVASVLGISRNHGRCQGDPYDPSGKAFQSVHGRRAGPAGQHALVCGRYEGIDERIRQLC